MATVVLVRHARSAANATGVLAGRTAGVGLDETGERQAAELVGRLAAVPLARAVSSPLDRCLATVRPLLEARPEVRLAVEDRLDECDYGEWTGEQLARLSRTTLWRAVQSHPSGVTFPGGESMRAMQARAVDAVREHDAAAEAEHGPRAVWLAVSHGDVIKSVVADALGLHLDQFQRIVVDPASVTVIRYTATRPFLVRLNDLGTMGDPRPPAQRRRRGRGTDAGSPPTASDAVVGGSTG